MADHNSLRNGDSVPSRKDNVKTNATKTTNEAPSKADSGKLEISNAEKKRLAKAEKAARRAAEKNDTNATLAASDNTKGRPVHHPQSAKEQGSSVPLTKVIQGVRRASIGKEQKSKQIPSENKATMQKASQDPKEAGMLLPIRRRMSHSTATNNAPASKQVSFFAHLYGQPRKASLEMASKDVHPAILTLGLHLSDYTICGSQARCVGMLLALKSIIRSYTTPHGTSLPRHLSSHYLSPQLSHIKSSRPFSVTQANAIRWLKNYIANIDPSVPETKAKNEICEAVDTFIRERFTVADQVIAEVASGKVRQNDVILTYGKSAVVQQALLAAARKGVNFRVVVVDSKPLFEGRNLARALTSIGIQVTYSLINGLAHTAKEATMCMLGAHAILGNGRIYSRVGTALVAMSAKEYDIPVVVCAESIKFTERVALDSIVLNELAPEEEMDLPLSGLSSRRPPSSDETSHTLLGEWRIQENLNLLNPLFDTTPSNFVDLVITEYGSLPPTSALLLQRMSAGL